LNRRRWFELALLLVLAFVIVSERPRRSLPALTAAFGVETVTAVSKASVLTVAPALPGASRARGSSHQTMVCKWVANAFETGLFVRGAGPHSVYVGPAFYDLTLPQKSGALAALAACEGDEILLAYDLRTGRKVADYSQLFGLRMQ
jgi:hypothetical protein